MFKPSILNQSNDIKSCTIIGSGNVATHIACALASHISIKQIYSRDISHAQELVDKIVESEDYQAMFGPSHCGADAVLSSEKPVAYPQAISNLADLQSGADIYIIAVPDDHIAGIIEATSAITDGIWTHTSGSMPIDLFAGCKMSYGVFYPLQTFSKNKPLDFTQVPMLIEGSDSDVADALIGLANKISRDVKKVGSDGRKQLHIAAVFACNFVNYLWAQADEILKDVDLNINVLRPLLTETLDKLQTLSPRDAQTGPARRGDVNIINKHLAMLDERKAEIYRFLTDKIIDEFKS